MGVGTGVALTARGTRAWRSITTQSSARSSYLGQTRASSGIGAHRGSSQASVPVGSEQPEGRGESC